MLNFHLLESGKNCGKKVKKLGKMNHMCYARKGISDLNRIL